MPHENLNDSLFHEAEMNTFRSDCRRLSFGKIPKNVINNLPIEYPDNGNKGIETALIEAGMDADEPDLEEIATHLWLMIFYPPV